MMRLWSVVGARAEWGRAAVALLVGLVGVVELCTPGAAFAASRHPRVRVSMAGPRRVAAGGLASFTGRASRVAHVDLAVERRVGRKWVLVVRGQPGQKGGYALTWITPTRAQTVRVRAVALEGSRVVASSPVRRLVITKAKGRLVTVSANDQVVSAQTVVSAPAPGEAGVLRYAGGNQVRVGQIIAVGPGPRTPYGFLGKVTSVGTSAGQTVVSTVPATLMQAIPTGSFDETISQAPVTAATRLPRGSRSAEETTVDCKGSAGASIDADASIGVSVNVQGDWSLLHGLESAQLSATADADASVTATVEGKGSCELDPIQIAKVKGPGDTFFIGPIPVVLTSQLLIDVNASASVGAKLTTGISGGYHAASGIAWKRGDGFHPIHNFGPSFKYTPPTLTANADVSASIDPTIQVSLDGGGHANLNLSAGLDLNADTTKNPWWDLTAPVSVTGDLDISKLGLSSRTLTIYRHDFDLVHAPGPFSGEGGSGAGGVSSTGGAPDGGGEPPLGGPGGGASGGTPQPGTLGAGEYFTCVVVASGGVDCWGSNALGDLGNGTTTGPDACYSGQRLCSTTPVAVPGIADATQVSAGDTHACALLESGIIECWGQNRDGDLGDGSIADSYTPVKVEGITNAVQVSAGVDDTCAVLATGEVKCWGNNNLDQLGDGMATGPQWCDGLTSYCAVSPVAVAGLANATEVSTGDDPCARLTTGIVECWGYGADGELGDGATTESDVPVPVTGIANAIQVSQTCALLVSGSVACWGLNSLGTLGDGTSSGPSLCYNPDSEPCSTTPVAVSGITDATDLSSAGDVRCVVRASGGVECWGFNGDGELGDGTTLGPETCNDGSEPCSTVPVAALGLSDAVEVSAGQSHVCALRATGTLDCWGLNGNGELGDGTTVGSSIPVAVDAAP